MRLLTTNDRAVNYVRALVHGDSGIGKTTSLGTLPEDKTLIVVLERGLLPLAGRYYRVLQVETWEDLRVLVGAFHAAEVAEDGSLSMTIGDDIIAGVRILAVDSLTEINRLCKRQIVAVDRKAVLLERTRGKRDSVEGIYDDLMTQEDWGLLASRMSGLIGALTHLNAHVIVTSLTGWREDKRTGEQFQIPALNGAFAMECPAHFDLVLHMEAIKGEDGSDCRVWRTANSGRVLAKDASGLLAPLEPANWTALFAKILGRKTTTETEG